MDIYVLYIIVYKERDTIQNSCSVALHACTPWFLTYRGDLTVPTTEQLCPSPCACDLKVECLIKLPYIFGLE